MVVFLPVLVLTEGATVACSVTAATSLAGLAPTVPAALGVEESKGDGQNRTDPTCPDNLPTDEKECVCIHVHVRMRVHVQVCMFCRGELCIHPQLPKPREKKIS